jgi:hypothetical protein
MLVISICNVGKRMSIAKIEDGKGLRKLMF